MRGFHLAAAVLILGLLPPAAWAETAMRATVGHPARVSAAPAAAALTGSAEIGTGQLLVRVAAYAPPPDKKPVEIVVRARLVGGLREIGRFAIMPASAFDTKDAAHMQSFALPLPADLKDRRSLELSVAIEPVRGGGRGAAVRIDSAAIH